MSYTNLYSYTVDGCQRVSYCRTPSLGVGLSGRYRESSNDRDNSGTGDGLIICKNLIIGCKPETTDDFRPFIFEPTWCVYIRAQDNVDMGHYVKRVTFRMSPRLPLRLHVADASPFEITEVLSTDFPVELQVDYLDSSMSSTTYVYKPNDVFDGKYNVELRMNFQGHERKDKMFFMNPPITMQLSLNTTTPMPTARPKAMNMFTMSTAMPSTPTTMMSGLPEPVKSSRQQQQQQQQPSKLKSDELDLNPYKLPTAPRPIFNVRLSALSEVSPDRPQSQSQSPSQN
ncbi:uncharacterized protein LOC117793922 [Drosophila innubila]|uniref:uncharacterized protein LOC117793922 n=1 Tax=Drosophila innubila TaxID=198719 RepID=UPI00148C212E|nr:uncharacterized protein LOC117793922 [Drosophila innubila]